MLLNLLLYIFILAIGIIVGYKEKGHKKLLERLDIFQILALIFLLFVMGLRIGADEQVIKSINVLGAKALLFAVMSIVFSVLFVWIIRKIMKFNKRGIRS